MIRLRRLFFLILMMVLATQARAGQWQTVGGDPFIGNAGQAIQKFQTLTPDQRRDAINRFETGRVVYGTMPRTDPRTGKSQVADLMVYGRMKVMAPANFAWTTTDRLGVEFLDLGNVKVIHVIRCNNWLAGNIYIEVPKPKVQYVPKPYAVPRPYPVHHYETICLPGKVVKETVTRYVERPPVYWTPAPLLSPGSPPTTIPGTFGLWWQPSLHQETPEQVCPGPPNPPPQPVYPPPCDP